MPPRQCNVRTIVILSAVLTFKVFLLTIFGCWITSSCGMSSNDSIKLTGRAAYMGTSDIYPCCTKVANQMSKAQTQIVTGYHYQRRDGTCHIAAIILLATHEGQNKTWCMNPQHLATQRIVSKFKREKALEKGINTVMQQSRSYPNPN